MYAHLRLSPDHEGSPGEETHPDDAMLARLITTAREQVEHDRTELEAMVAESARAAIVRLEAIAAKLAAVTKTKA